MPHAYRQLTLATLTAGLCLTAASAQRPGIDWPQFRGMQAAGRADGYPLPTKWNVKDITWKAAMPGLAHSSPIVWGERVFITTAVAKGGPASLKIGLYGAGDSAEDMVEHAFQVWCLRLTDGRVDWVRTATRCTPKFARHTKATHVDATPVTDGAHVVALFGSQGMFCYSVDGEFRWKVDLGDLDVGPHNSMDLHWGYASSPVIADGKVIVQADVKKKPFLAAFDVKTGKQVWRVERDDLTSWATPTVIATQAGMQVITNGCKHMGGYMLADGKETWRMAGGGGLPVPAPLLAGDLILFTSNHRPIHPSHPVKPVFAVHKDATGTLPIPEAGQPTKFTPWMKARVGSYIQTPIVYRGLLYVCQGKGIVSVLDAQTGELHGRRHRIGPGGVGFSASPVAGSGHVYITSEEGEVYVYKAGKEFEALGKSELGEICMATPAIASGRLIFRTRHHVMCVGGKTK